jgi:hypothetical protein
MVIKLTPKSTVLFQGDSNTASGRCEDPDGGLGDGYARLAADLLRVAHPRPRPSFSTGALAETAWRICGPDGTGRRGTFARPGVRRDRRR